MGKVVIWGLLIIAAIIAFPSVSGIVSTDDIRRFIASFQPTPAPVVVVIITPTPNNAPTSTLTPIPTAEPTNTNTPIPEPTSAATHTATPVPTATATLRPTFTPTPIYTAAPTATGTSTSTPTITPTVTPTAFVCGYAEMVLIGAGKKHKHCHTPTPEGYVSPPHTNTPVSVSTATQIPINTPRAVVVPTHTSTPESTSEPTPAPSEYTTYTDIVALEDRTHAIINDIRTEQGLAELEMDEQIRHVARAHSEDMATRKYFSHQNPEGLRVRARADIAGAEYCRIWAENIHRSWLYASYRERNGVRIPRNWRTPEELAQLAVRSWMDSTKGHREAILNSEYHKAGLGVAIADDGQIFFTQNFCARD